jgi:hypothetical protein
MCLQDCLVNGTWVEQLITRVLRRVVCVCVEQLLGVQAWHWLFVVAAPCMWGRS